MAEKKKSYIVRFLAFLALVIILLLLFLFGLNFYNKNFTTKEIINNTINNTVIIQNLTTIEQQTIVNESSLTAFFIVVPIVLLIAYLSYLLFKYLNTKRPFTQSNRKICIKKAIEILKEQGYNIAVEEPKQSYRYFGVDMVQNKSWIFIFVTNSVLFNQNIETIPEDFLVSCMVDATTLDVMNEHEGWNLTTWLLHLKNVRFGEEAVPTYAGKTERKPVLEDLFTKAKPNISLSLNEGDDDTAL